MEADDNSKKFPEAVYDSNLVTILNYTCPNDFTYEMDTPVLIANRFSLVLTLCNIILNGFCLKIFYHRIWRKSTISILLKWLSFVEVLFALSNFFSKLQPEFEPEYLPILNDEFVKFKSGDTIFTTNVKQRLAYYTMHKVFMFFACSTQIIRNWTVVLLAAYRYDAVCRPIGSQAFFTPKTIYIIISTTVFLSGIGTFPRTLESKVEICPVNGVSNTKPFLIIISAYQIYYLGVVILIIQSFGPLFLISGLSAFVVKKISQRRQYHKELKAQTKPNQPKIRHQNSINRPTTDKLKPSSDFLVLLLCFVFFITETPAFFSKILAPYLSEKQDMIFGIISNTLIMIDSTLNFFVYMGSNPTFRTVSNEFFLSAKQTLSTTKSPGKRTLQDSLENDNDGSQTGTNCKILTMNEDSNNIHHSLIDKDSTLPDDKMT